MGNKVSAPLTHPIYGPIYPLTVSPHSAIEIGDILAVALWTGLRDMSASIISSGVGFAVTLSARILCHGVPQVQQESTAQRLAQILGTEENQDRFEGVPGAHHGIAAISVVAVAFAGFFFGSAGTWERRSARTWIGVGTAAVGVALTLASVYRQESDLSRTDTATNYLGMAIAALTRDFIQAQAGRIFPEVRLHPERALRWALNANTRTHLLRLGTHMVLYAGMSITLSRWVALRNLLHPDYSGMNRELGMFSSDSWRTFAFRGLNEGIDGAVGVMLLACFFHGHLRRGHGWLTGPGITVKEVARRGGSRVAMNQPVSAIQSLIPSKDWYLAALQGVTVLRGAVLNLEPTWPGTAGGGDCLLHAAADVLDGGEWRCDAARIRAALCNQIRRLAQNSADSAESLNLVEHHLEQAVSQMRADAGEPAYAVLDGNRLLETLPETLRSELEASRPEQHPLVANRWLNEESQRAALLHSVARYYEQDGCYLPTRVLPCLARVLNRPLALHGESTTVMYDAEGNALNDPAENMVHIRHRLSIHGEAGDHFERIEASSARRRENGELQSPQETGSLTQSGNTAGTKSSMKASHQHIELAIESETQLHVGHGNESNNNARQRTTPRSGQGQHNQRTDSMNGESREQHEKTD